MKKLGLALILISLSFLVACGGGSSTSSGGGPTPQGSFSNASLSGQYTYQLRGYDYSGTSTVEFRETGVLVADGAGHITNGEDDFSEISFGDSNSSLTGAYAIRNDGIGTAVINLGSGGLLTLAISMVDTTKAQITEFDSFATGAGSLLKQNTAVTTVPPTGNFAFHLHNIGGFFANTSSSTVGLMNLTSGVGAGSEDTLRSGAVSSLSLNAFFNTPDSLGRGTGTLTDTITTSFVYYIVDANTIHIMTGVPGLIGLGAAQVQTGGPFSASSLNGNFIFGLRGDTNNFGTEGSGTTGRFKTDAAGNITEGTLDEAADGAMTATDAALTPGLYTLASNGRGTLTLNAPTGTRSEIFYMVGPGSAYTLTNDPSKVEDGSFSSQQATTYANSTLNGQYAFFTHGYTSTDINDRAGTMILDGSGKITLTYLLNTLTGGPHVDPGTGNALTLSFTGTYSVGSDGRVTATVGSVSNNFVFYLRSGNDGDMLQADSATEISGSFSKQQ